MGLPDLITRTPDPGKFTVQLNYGYRLGRPFAWTTSAWSVQSVGVGQAIVEGADKLLGDFSSQIGVDTVRVHDSGSNSVGGSAGVTIGNFGASGGAGTIFNATRALVDLVDVNGDGLPDQVMKVKGDHGFLRVKLNLGDHFGNEETWRLPDWGTDVNDWLDSVFYVRLGGVDDALEYRRSNTYSGNITVEVCFAICIGGSAFYSNGSQWQYTSFQDVDGDGKVDQVFKRRDSGNVIAKLNQIGKTNLLSAVPSSPRRQLHARLRPRRKPRSAQQRPPDCPD